MLSLRSFRHFALPLLLASTVTLPAQIVTDSELPEKPRLEIDPEVENGLQLTWFGREGFSYFLQTTTDLVSEPWQYLPVIETGHDANIQYGLIAPTPRFFARVVLSEQTANNPMTADFDGDGISNIDELNRLYDPLANRDDDGDGHPDDWERFFFNNDTTTTSDAFADQDTDGLSDYEEAMRGTDPELEDTDGDGVLDGADSWPRHEALNPPILPSVRYAVVPLQALDSFWTSDSWPKALANNGDVLIQKGVVNWIYHLATNTKTQVPTGFEISGFSPEGIVFGSKDQKAALFSAAQGLTLLDYPPVSLTNTAQASFAVDQEERVIGGDAINGWITLWSGIWLQPPVQSNVYTGRSRLIVQRNGSVLMNSVFDSTNGVYTGQILLPDGRFSWSNLTKWEPDLGVVVQPALNTAVAIVDGVTHDLGINGYLADSLPAIAQQPLIGIWKEYGTGEAWISLDGAAQPFRLWDASTQKESPVNLSLGWSAEARVNMRYQILAGDKIIINGQVESLAELVGSGDWVSGQAIDDHGVICGHRRKTIDAAGLPIPPANQITEPALLLPASFVVPHANPVPDRQPLDAFLDTVHGPTVSLDEIELSDITISNGIATVTVSGEIIDAPMGVIPPGQGGDIAEVIVFINGQETSVRGTVTRAAQPATFWAPYIDKGVIAPITISFPARDVASIELQTVPNALGLVGRAGFDVAFEETTPAPGTLPGVTYTSDLVFPATLSATAADSILLTEVNATTGETLAETSEASGIFVNATHTASFTLYNLALDVGGAVVGPIKGRLSGLVDLPVGASTGQGHDQGEETAPGSLRFRFSVTRAAQPLPRVPSWELDSVTMHPAPAGTPAAPIGFASVPLDTLKLNFLDANFTLEVIDDHPDQSAAFAVTAAGKPLLGFVVVREEDPEDPETEWLREFVYYDHTEGELTRRPMSYAGGHQPWALKLGATDPVTFAQKTLAKTIRLVDATGAQSPGFLPVEIENLVAFLDEEPGVEIAEDATFYLELTGHVPGEVARVFSTEATDDHFDLVIPGAEPLLKPHPVKHTVLTEISTGVYRTTEKVVVYSTPGEPTRRLSESDWADLKALGYVAIHNEGITIRSGEDLARWLTENGMSGLHPDANAVLGAASQAGAINPTSYIYEGFEDHHVFNAWHKNEAKSARWNKIFGQGWKNIFGEDFDVDEFTVPVHTRTHRKMTSAITQRWEDFLGEYFDEAGNLKAGVNMADLRKNTMDKMYSICDEFQIDTSKMRIWPQVLRNRPASDTLYKRIVASQGKLGASLNKLTQIKQLAYDLKTQAGRTTFRQRTVGEVRKTAQRHGKRGAVQMLPMVSLALTATTTAILAVNYNQLGWEEALAQHINSELGLDDLELAREFVRARFSGSYISGGTPRLSIQVNPSKSICLAQRIYKIIYANGEITSVMAYTVVELKVFPDGKRSVALVREDYPDEVEHLDNPRWIIDDYWPRVGDPVELHFRALRNAKWLE